MIKTVGDLFYWKSVFYCHKFFSTSGWQCQDDQSPNSNALPLLTTGLSCWHAVCMFSPGRASLLSFHLRVYENVVINIKRWMWMLKQIVVSTCRHRSVSDILGYISTARKVVGCINRFRLNVEVNWDNRERPVSSVKRYMECIYKLLNFPMSYSGVRLAFMASV